METEEFLCGRVFFKLPVCLHHVVRAVPEGARRGRRSLCTKLQMVVSRQVVLGMEQ